MTIRSFSFACLGLGASILPGAAWAEDEAGAFDSDAAVTAPAERSPADAPAAAEVPPVQPAPVPRAEAPLPAPTPARPAKQLPTPRAPVFAIGDESTAWGTGIWLDFDRLFLTREADKRMAGSKKIWGSGLSVSYDVLRLSPKAALSLDLGWSTERSSAAWSSGAAVDVRSHVFRLGAALRYDLCRWLAPYARVTGGGGWSRMEATTVNWAELTDTERFWQASLGGGLSLNSPTMSLGSGPRPWRLSVALNLEGGYIVGPKTAFTLQGQGSSSAEREQDRIDVVGVSVGEVSRSRPYLRISTGVRF